MRTDIGYSEYPTIFHALKAQIMRTIRTWRYARSIGADPTKWWGVYEKGTEICLASVGPLPGAEQRARRLADTLGQTDKHPGPPTPSKPHGHSVIA